MGSRKKHIKQRASGHSDLNARKHQNPVWILEGIAGALLMLGYMLTLSPFHKRIALLVFFAAYVIAGLGVVVKLYPEFSLSDKLDKQPNAPLETPTPTTMKEDRPNKSINTTNQHGDNFLADTMNFGPQPRSIPAAARRSLIATLSSAKPATTKPFIGIDTPFGDAEAKSFANEFRQVFEEAGWEVGMAQVGFSEEPIGLFVVARSKDDIPIQVTIIRVALAEAGFGSIPGVFMPGINEHSVRLIVGAKPKE